MKHHSNIYQTKQNSKKNSPKLIKLKYLLDNLQNSSFTSEKSETHSLKNLGNLYQKTGVLNKNTSKILLGKITTNYNEKSKNFSKDLSLYLSLIEKPVNLLFSIDQFLFEFSKKTYQQKKTEEFFQQLKERKKLSLFYGSLTRKQVNSLFNHVKTKKGYFSKNIFSLLERRLDISLYRSGFSKTIAEARQLIKHKKILVNSKFMTLPGYLLNPGDIISLTSETADVLKSELLNRLKPIQMKNHPKVFGDFYSKLNKILESGKPSEKSSNLNKSLKNQKIFRESHNVFSPKMKEVLGFKSQGSRTLIQFLCTRIKLRAFWNLKKDNFSLTKPEFRLTLLDTQNLTLLKWKASLLKTTGNIGSGEPQFGFSSKNAHKVKNLLQENFYASDGCLQKKPLFWKHGLINSPLDFTVNAKHFSDSVMFRNSFLIFLKDLENFDKFTNLLHLNIKKSLFKHSYSKQKVLFRQRNSQIPNLKKIKAIHLEISYSSLHFIYLFSPQRINLPFFIDLDLIKRSLR